VLDSYQPLLADKQLPLLLVLPWLVPLLVEDPPGPPPGPPSPGPPDYDPGPSDNNPLDDPLGGNPGKPSGAPPNPDPDDDEGPAEPDDHEPVTYLALMNICAYLPRPSGVTL